MRFKAAWRYFTAAWLLLVIMLSSGCEYRLTNSSPLTDDALNALVRPYQFNLGSWEVSALLGKVKQKIKVDLPEESLRSRTVVDFFDYRGQLDNLERSSPAPDVPAQKDKLKRSLEELRPQVEAILAGQISQALADQGIFNPAGNALFKFTFPPVSFDLEGNLNILMISPRESIQRLTDYTIKPDISTAEAEKLEGELQDQNLSALVIPIGGLGAAYPSFVIETSDLQFTLNVVAEEWLHQYLAFKPLGSRYVLNLLGYTTDNAIPTINETVAGMVSKEIGALVYKRYYAEYFPQNEGDENAGTPARFDFNAAMRETRLKVDRLLAQGQYQEAESYMEQRRLYINQNGYNLRKLNQAYFAFYGSYADSPTSVDPIGNDLRVLRQESPTLKQFLDTASGITSKQDLTKLIGQP